ncbi:bifunctional UDP-N-acetylglucosamine diphosphorylase/glucosamine-1-phosphate N-acetyltransferase GlmU [Xylophilus sp. ASV27]|uniref:bifunctional UDP-N-acetylglucosamine diphosphorylase/glucosamine-1-phosphate N-acetyltransferase GlmU n=1 Tax=Xylophilus sp. ASV27 TaxID=2795129 RepID=UPI0018EAF1BC|nr:bifunctional UDP-N-acetylglucosamine diphosphorylase/glucosamine-1-phosphate N-acetyltransferase GlmU [Xylophilus sp. ASV27]
MAGLDVVVMAAGKGTRMKSRLPKVLHRLAGRPMVRHVLDAVAALGARRVVLVTGHGAEAVEAALRPGAGQALPFALDFARQEPQLGTGHAVQQAAPLLPEDGTVLVLNGDVPLITAATLRALAAAAADGALAVLTIALDDPSGYGRIVRDARGAVRAIVEHKDASAAERAIRETNAGMMAVPGARLRGWLARLHNRNAQGEYYLTDIVALAVADGVPVRAVTTEDAVEVAGVNSPAQLAALERAFQRRQAERLMEAGVRLADPARFDLRGTLQCGADVEIDVGCVFEGEVSLGEGVRIGAHCVIADARIAAGAVIHPFSHVAGGAVDKGGAVEVGEGALVGPFARLRPGARLGAQVHIGNFVEVKNSTLAEGAKANHLAYLGDATVGARVNYGAGSITANYDGVHKHRTVIGDDVQVGSNCVLVAPVTLGAGSTVAGGSTITKDTPAGALAVARGRQVSIEHWKRPVRTAQGR